MFNTLPVGTKVVDETSAGDCYRAASPVPLAEVVASSSHSSNNENEGDDDNMTHDVNVIKTCMKCTSDVGALAAIKEGAILVAPSREEIGALVTQNRAAE